MEIFSFLNPPPASLILRHIAFSVSDLDTQIAEISSKGIAEKPVRIDELTGQRFTFFPDPDGLPIELHGVQTN